MSNASNSRFLRSSVLAKLSPLSAGVSDQHTHSNAQSLSTMLVQHRNEALFELPLALWNNDTTFQQDCSERVYQSRSFPPQPFSGSVECLHIELGFCLHLDETHRRT